MHHHALSNIFFPKSIAVVGASANPEKLGYACVEGILIGGYRGTIYPINPTACSILGIECLANASELPEDVDLAIIMLPAEKVPGVLEILAARKVKGVLIPAGGFAESGARGIDLQRAIQTVCAQSAMRVLGPNIPGFINADASLVATLAGGPIGGGPLAIISQAGSVGYALIRGLHAKGIEFGRFICLGNQADISDAEVIEFLESDSKIHAIGLYIESVKDGRRFVDVARRVSRTKPIVVLKGGRTSAGLGAIFSHTASISSPDRIYQAAFRRAGVIPAQTLSQLGMLTFSFGRQPPARGDRIAIVTSLAGMGVIASDSCERLRLSLPSPSPATKALLEKILPPMASMRNPIDLTGDVTPAMLAHTIQILAASGEYDGIIPLVMGVPGSESFGNAAYASQIDPVLTEAVTRGIAISVGWVMDEVGGAEFNNVSKLLHAHGIPVSEMPEDAAEIMGGMVERGRIARSGSLDRQTLAAAPPQGWQTSVKKQAAAGAAVLTEHEAKTMLQAAGLRVTSSRLATSAEAAAASAHELGFPVVLKMQSADLPHKSDIGGVILGLRNEAEVSAAYEALVARFNDLGAGKTLDGIGVQPMIQEHGVELVCGISEDPQFGKYVMVGLGGVSIELLQDVSLRLLPVDDTEIDEMLRELKAAALLEGHRGKPTVDRVSLIRFIADICRLGDTPEVAELELNPILATSTGTIALDARMRLHAASNDGEAGREGAHKSALAEAPFP
jgi:acetate---CoA ligase (ADP-forming)